MLIQMKVAGAMALADGSHVLTILEIDGQRTGAILMQFTDILAVIAAIKGLRGARPSVHIAWTETVRSANITLEQLLIHGIGRDDAVLCKLCFRQMDRTWTVDCRPSDGITLALRLQAPIVCEEAILNLLAVEAEQLEQQFRHQDDANWREYFNSHDDIIPKS